MLLAESRIVLTEKTGDKKDIFYILETIDALLASESAVNKFTMTISTHVSDRWLENKWVSKILIENGYKICRAADYHSMDAGYIEKQLPKIHPVHLI
jgi:hypothetical protein